MDGKCDHETCASILSRLRNFVRAQLSYADPPGYSDVCLGVRVGLLDFDEGVTIAARAGLSEANFILFMQQKRHNLGNTAFIWKELRKLIFERDQGCVKCREGYQQVHHIVGIAMGGDVIKPCNLRALCKSCHQSSHRGHPLKPRGARKKTLSTLKDKVAEATILFRDSDEKGFPSPPQHGQRPDPHVYFNNTIALRGLLVRLLHADVEACHKKSPADRWKRVDMVMEGLRLQATRGKCFVSASYLASHARANKKTWERTLHRLRSQALVVVEHLFRENGMQATNLIDFSPLWAVILSLLRGSLPKLERLSDGSLWAKLKGLWIPLEDLLLESLPPPEAHSQPSLL